MDAREFETVYMPLRETIAGIIRRKCYAYGMDLDLVNDLTQETLLICWEKRETVVNPVYFSVNVAKTVFTRFRVNTSSKREAEIPENAAYPAAPDAEEELTPAQVWTRAALASLTEAERELLYARVVGGVSSKRLAQELGLSAIQVDVKLRLLRERLRNFDMEENERKQVKRRLNAAILSRFNAIHQEVIREVLSHPTPTEARREVAEKHGLSYNAVKKIMARYKNMILAM